MKSGHRRIRVTAVLIAGLTLCTAFTACAESWTISNPTITSSYQISETVACEGGSDQRSESFTLKFYDSAGVKMQEGSATTLPVTGDWAKDLEPPPATPPEDPTGGWTPGDNCKLKLYNNEVFQVEVVSIEVLSP